MWEVRRTAIDLDLAQPVLLAVTVSVHRCAPCRRYFRAQPPFLRRDAVYSTRVVAKAVASVYEDGVAIRRVARRLARDFWVQPSEKMIRRWCRDYAATQDFATDYLPWVVESFSGVLCVDEVYQGKLALLLAVDPAGRHGDRLVGYQLVQGTVDQPTVARFLQRLRAAGVVPDQVITDGAAVYPTLLRQVWPLAAQQLCLFHETRRVTTAVGEVVQAVRKTLPKPPPRARPRLGGRRRQILPPDEATDAATERWRWREARRREGIAQVHALRRRGRSLRSIAQQTGFNRRTVTAWLRQELPEAPEAPEVTEPAATAPRPPSRAVPPPAGPLGEQAPPPARWDTWDTVRATRDQLKQHRGLFLRRPQHLTAEDEHQLQTMLASPVGGDLSLARRFLEEWYAVWHDEGGQRHTVPEAAARYRHWQTNRDYGGLTPLRRVQQAIDADRFARLSQFLRTPTWEATNNGAERMGRAFRHAQGPHYHLRTVGAIDDALRVRACLHKAAALAATDPTRRPASRCGRGRKPRRETSTPAPRLSHDRRSTLAAA